MSSYAVIGASRGIGLEYINTLSQNKSNQVFAVVRTPQNATKLAALAEASPNVHVVQGDLDDASSLRAAAEAVSKITGGSLDYLINNGAAIVAERAHLQITEYPDEKSLESDLVSAFRTNVIGVTNAINAFLPLLRAGTSKKIVAISTGAGDLEFARLTGMSRNSPYPISKAALNMAVVQFALALKPEGFTVLALSPGAVNTWGEPTMTAEEYPDVIKGIMEAMKTAAPGFSGVAFTPAESVELQLKVIHEVGPEDSGAFLSHFGNKQWL